MDLFNIGFNVDSRQVAAGSAALRTFAADTKKVENQIRESVGKINAAFKSIKPSVPIPQLRAAVRAQTAVQVQGAQDVALARRREEVNYTAWWERQLRARERAEQAAANRTIREAERVARAQQRAQTAAARAARPAVAGGTGTGGERGFGEIGVLRLRNILLGAAIYQTIQFGRALLTTSDLVKGMDSRLRLVTKSQREYNRVTEALTEISKRNLIGLNEVTNLYFKIMGGLKGVAGATTIALETTASFSAALRVGGANTREASAAAIQFAQAIGSGVLRGDEFRSLAEASPILLQNMADGLGVTRGALKSMADEGLLTANMAIGALLKTAVRAEIQSIGFGNTISGAGVQIQNSFIKMVEGIERSTGAFSAVASAGRGVAAMLDMVVPAIEAVKRAVVALAPALVGLTAAMTTFFAVSRGGAAFAAIAAGFTAIRIAIVGVSTALASGGLVALLTNPAVIPILAALTALVAITAVAASQMGLGAEDEGPAPRSRDADEYLMDLKKRVAAAQELGKVQSQADLDAIDKANERRQRIEALRKAMDALGANDEQRFEINKEIKKLDEALTAEGNRRIEIGRREAEQAKRIADEKKRRLELERLIAGVVADVDIAHRTLGLMESGVSQGEASGRASLENKGVGIEDARLLITSLDVAQTKIQLIADARAEAEKFMEMDTTNLGEGFDRASNAMFNFMSGFERLIEMQLEYNNAVAQGKNVEQARQKLAAIQIDTFASMAGAAKGFFKEGSKGYKALGAAEKTLRAIQIAGQLKDLLVTTFVEQSKWQLYGVTAQAAALTIPPPASFAALAAVVAILASLGIRTGGGGGKSFKGNTGTGTVLGDKNAGSESLTKSLDALVEIQDKSLRVSMAMLQSLYSIEAGINGVTTSIAQRRALGLGTTPFSRRSLLQAEGLRFGSQTAGQIAGGQQLNARFFGTRYDPAHMDYDTSTASLDAQLQNDLTEVAKSIISAASDAAMAFGMTQEQVTATLNGLTIALGDVNLKGLTGEEIQQRLAAVFGKLGDQVAGALVPAMTEFQQIGEGLLETLIRVASQTIAVTEQLQALGLVMSTDILTNARSIDDLIQLSGGLDNFGQSLSDFTENFYTDAERTIMLQESLQRSFDELGVAMPTTAAAFRQLVTSLDINDESQRRLFASLIELSGQTDEYFDALEDAAGSVNKLVDSLRALRDEAARNAAATRPAEQQLGSIRSAFQTQATLAALGNTGAAEMLPELGKQFMQASLAFSSTQAEYLRDLAYIQNAAERAAQVQERGMGFVTPTTTLAAGAGTGAVTNTTTATPMTVGAGQTFDNSGIIAELRSLREELHSNLFTVAKNTGKASDLLTRWDDGDQMRVTSDTLLEVAA